jgi:hypothetical protein
MTEVFSVRADERVGGLALRRAGVPGYGGAVTRLRPPPFGPSFLTATSNASGPVAMKQVTFSSSAPVAVNV